ncbi:MAG: TetR/AcrR family transcriptional regulator [Agitococcus sp.]|nr:TetR/AcrR family transcriptional regulator [Agitococcus sp.]
MARPKKIAGAPDTRELILDAACEEFAVTGVSARLEDIAARCGIRSASLMYYFPSKQELMDTLFERVNNLLIVRSQEAFRLTEGNYAAAIRSVTQAIRQVVEEQIGTANVMLHGLLSEDSHDVLKQHLQKLLEIITGLAMSAGANSYHSRETVHAVISHIFMGELIRVALGSKAERYWGNEDAVMPLIEEFFKLKPERGN